MQSMNNAIKDCRVDEMYQDSEGVLRYSSNDKPVVSIIRKGGVKYE